jgi:hypothetical protein
MDHKKAKITLGKLNVLFNSLEDAGEEISSIEKDLMLNYIKQLYEAVLNGDPITIPKLPENRQTSFQTDNKSKAEPKFYLPEQEEDKKATVLEKEDENPKTEVKKSIEEDTKGQSSEEDKSLEKEIDESLKTLFAIEEATELSHKLSLTPIKDLKKSMGINEKIFTVKELFNGDQKTFDECLAALNEFKSFEEAKKFLAIGPATDFDWSEKEKEKKAKTFIKLVHRRYQ